jgi:GT2 family glycosyltransferase
MSSLGSVQIIILNWNGYELTRECLLSLAAVDYGNFRITVVDNASSDGSYEKLVGEFPEIEFVRSEVNLGFAGGNNLGINFARTNYDPDFFLLLNNDTTVDPRFLTHLVTSFHAGPDVGIAGNKIFYYGDPQRIWFAGGVFDKQLGDGYHRGEGEIDLGQFDEPENVDFITGCCLMMSRQLVNAIGILDERFFAYCEDLDYSLRAAESGFVCRYVPASVIYHKVSSSFKLQKSDKIGKRSALAYYLNVRNRIFIFRKHRKMINRYGFLLFQLRFILRYVVGFALTFQFGKAKSVIKGAWKGVTDPLDTQQEGVKD